MASMTRVAQNRKLPAAECARFVARLLRWHARHGRTNLPWQKRRTPYRIWVAEVMLQQTRVDTVIPYYRKFIGRWRTIAALAISDEDELLHYWSGLGYYARARNLRKAAQQIVAHHNGRFPKQFDAAVALPGIGRSTAAAILAFAYGQPRAILDGNVKRVLARYFALAAAVDSPDGEKRLWQLAEQLTPHQRIADYTQAMMDLGAMLCVRAKPQCARCPLVADCRAFALSRVDDYPRRKMKRARPTKSAVMLLVKNRRAELLLIKRPPRGVWGGLWSLPEYAINGEDGSGDDVNDVNDVNAINKVNKINAVNAVNKVNVIDAARLDAIETWCRRQFGVSIKVGKPQPILRHSFTHFDLDIVPLPARALRIARRANDAQQCWYNPASPPTIGLPRAVHRLLDEVRH